MKRILVIGTKGQVSSCLQNAACDWADIVAIGRPQLDLTDTAAIADAVKAEQPDLVINAAAYTAVDKAESEPEIAATVNAEAPGAIAAAADFINVPIIHISTDYVFDGTGTRPYREDDETAPLGVYGKTKLDGERRVAEANPRHIIARTAWVYSSYGQNFVKSMLRLGANHDKLTIVSDQIGCPTSAHDLADMLLALGKRLCFDPNEDDYGVVNICGTGIASWYDFSKAVFENAYTPSPLVVPITTAEFPTPAQRPASSRLDMTRLETHFGLKMPSWNSSLEQVVSTLVQT